MKIEPGSGAQKRAFFLWLRQNEESNRQEIEYFSRIKQQELQNKEYFDEELQFAWIWDRKKAAGQKRAAKIHQNGNRTRSGKGSIFRRREDEKSHLFVSRPLLQTWYHH